MDLSLSMADNLMTAAVMEENPQFAQSMWQSIPEAWKGIPRLYCGVMY